MTIIYNPPYDSPIEDCFAKFATKFVNQTMSMTTQVDISTRFGNYRLDFVITAPNGKKTAIECDGKDFHNESRDEWRDAMILGSSDIHEIYRIKGKEISYRIEDVFYALSVWSPWLFDDRQKYNLQRLASNELRKRTILAEDTILTVNHMDTENEIVQLSQFQLEKRHKNIPQGRRQFWQTAFQFAQQHSGSSLDDIIGLYRAQNQNK